MFMPDCSMKADRPPHEYKLQTGQNLKKERTLVRNVTIQVYTGSILRTGTCESKVISEL